MTGQKKSQQQLLDMGTILEAFVQATQYAFVVLDPHGRVCYWNPAAQMVLGYTEEEVLGRKLQEFLIPRDQRTIYEEILAELEREAKSKHLELEALTRDGRPIPIELSILAVRVEGERYIVVVVRDITERRLTEQKVEDQLKTLTTLYTSAHKLSLNLNLRELAHEVAKSSVEIFGVSFAWVGYAMADGNVKPLFGFPQEIDYPWRIKVRWDDSPEGRGPTGTAIRSGFPQVVDDIEADPRFVPWRDLARGFGFRSSAAFPLRSRGHTFGALNLYSFEPGFFTPERLELFQAFANHAAVALENARLFEETQKRMKHIEALRLIDAAIASSFDLRVTFHVALEQITSQLNVDAACILRFDPASGLLDYAQGRGFRTRGIERSTMRLGQGLAGWVAQRRFVLSVPDLSNPPKPLPKAFRNLIEKEGFVSYYGVPLVAKGKLLGVLEVFNREPLEGNDTWLQFLEILGGQVAIAIEDVSLFSELQRKHEQLLDAYDRTLQGWARALALKEDETEQHSQRVTDLTVRVARIMGISGQELEHVKRGALLHDIGKIGIPDSILLKPAPLSEQEWEIMKKHTIYAFEMLSPIEYLRPAIDIPYCHHERWDGSGYPRGLKGEQIPLAARIFAVVDVWDALTSDRPYRKAWSREKAMEHIKQQAGKHFDPKVVKAFFKVLAEVGEPV